MLNGTAEMVAESEHRKPYLTLLQDTVSSLGGVTLPSE
jgi:pyrroline-5-carboxylate reductase